MNKVVYVPAPMNSVGRYETHEVPTGKTEPGFFGEVAVTRSEQRFVKTGESNCDIDGQGLTLRVEEAIDELNAEGFEVVTITPLTTGRYDEEVSRGLLGEVRAATGYGYSFTKGVMIVARRVKPDWSRSSATTTDSPLSPQGNGQ